MKVISDYIGLRHNLSTGNVPRVGECSDTIPNVI